MNKKRLGLIEGGLSSVVNVVLFVFKIAVGLSVGSIAMVADAWHTLSDTVTSLVVIAGFWFGSRPEDEEHPFGHGRLELIGAIVIGTLLAVVGFNFLIESVKRFGATTQMEFSTIAIVVFAVSAVVKEALAQFSLWAGRKTDSKSLKADGWHHRSDAIASAIIVVGAIASHRVAWLDAVLGLGVSLLILFAAYEIIRDVATQLLGERISPTMREKINAIVSDEAPDAEPAHHLHVHRYGDHVEATMHLVLPRGFSLDRAHEVADRIEERLRDELQIEPTIHVEPAASVPRTG